MMKSQALKLATKALTVFGLAGLLMGNQSCEKQLPPAVEERSLKKIIDVGWIDSRPVIMPDGNVFDFQFVVNQQIYDVLYQSKAFAFRYKSPIQGLGTLSDGSFRGQLNLTKASMDHLARLMGESSATVPLPSKDAKCFINKPQARINGAVTSFALKDGGGLSIGFNKSGNLPGIGLGASIEAKNYELELILRAMSPMKNSILASINQTNTKTDSAVSFGLSFGSFSIGPSYFYNTPMASLTRNTLTNAVMALKKEMEKEEWFSRVLYYDEGSNDLVAVIGGTNAGVQVGDQLAIYNETSFWNGEPCNSELAYEGGTTGSPVAIVQISEVTSEISSGFMLKPILQDFDPKLLIGAKVKIHQLKKPEQAVVQTTPPKVN